MEGSFLTEARHGLPMLLSRKLLAIRLVRFLSLPRYSDVFVIWARCKWDGKVRGFILEKACRRFHFPNVSVVSESRGLTIHQCMQGLSSAKISNKLAVRAATIGTIIIVQV